MYLLNGSCVLPGMQIIAQLKFPFLVNTNLASGCLLPICQSVSMKFTSQVYLPVAHVQRRGLMVFMFRVTWLKTEIKKTNFIPWKCFLKLEIPHCRYTTGSRYFLLSTAPVDLECIALFCKVVFFFRRLSNSCGVSLFLFFVIFTKVFLIPPVVPDPFARRSTHIVVR